MKTHSSLVPASRAVWLTFADGTRNQVTIPMNRAPFAPSLFSEDDADKFALFEASEYFTDEERVNTRAIVIVTHYEGNAKPSQPRPVAVPSYWLPVQLYRATRFAQEAITAPTREQAKYFFSLARHYWARECV